MDKLVISGGNPLCGRVKISGAKNAVLPVLAASLLAEGTAKIVGVPDLADVRTICAVLKRLGADVTHQGDEITVRVSELLADEAPYEYVHKMRASFLVMGPLLARLGHTRVSLPGGCAIGSRPIDLHLKGFKALGAKVVSGQGYVEASAKHLRGAVIYLDFPSVGATENLMMAAALAEGQTTIENAAEEPEIVDLANCLNNMGAKIRGAGTKVIKIDGVAGLKGAAHSVIPDRIEAGTFMAAAVITGGQVQLENVISEHLLPVISKLREAGAEITETENGLQINGPSRPRAVDIKTLPYPGFPTDLQAQVMALATVAEGTSVITETVFENRFMHVDELRRMGARIKIEGRTCIVEGVPRLTGAPVRATDLRAGAALVLAGLAACGKTEVTNLHHLDRGYEHLEDKLRILGAQIKREVFSS